MYIYLYNIDINRVYRGLSRQTQHSLAEASSSLSTRSAHTSASRNCITARSSTSRARAAAAASKAHFLKSQLAARLTMQNEYIEMTFENF